MRHGWMDGRRRWSAVAVAARVRAGLAVSACVSLLGCSVGGQKGPAEELDAGVRTTLAATDFVSSDVPAAEGDGTVVAPATADGAAGVGAADGSWSGVGAGLAAGGDGLGAEVGDAPSYGVQPGPPLLTGAASPSGDPVLLEAKVGDVNGRPVFAGEFLEPLEGRLRAEARRRNRSEWLAFASKEIDQQLEGLITDELLRAEAISRLTEEEKAGFRAFADIVLRQNLVSNSRGSRALAERRLREESGLTEQEFLRRREEALLVRRSIELQIKQRVNVSWRDIVQRYERDAVKYNPPPTVNLRVLSVSKRDAAAVAAVTEALAAGRTFDEVSSAEGPGKDASVVAASKVLEGAWNEAEFFPVAGLNEAVHRLEGRPAGSVEGPVETATAVRWVELAGVEQESRSLYEAQLGIEREILGERLADEVKRTTDLLVERASITDVQQMGVSLLRIADQRYGPKAGAGR